MNIEIILYLIEKGYIQEEEIKKFLCSKGEILLKNDPCLLSFCWDYGELSLQLKGSINMVRIEGNITYNQ